MPVQPFNQVDPFTQVHQAIWAALIAYAPWAAFVPPGARINAVPAGPLSTKAPAVTPGQNPELRIVQVGWGFDRGNSMTYDCDQVFLLQMSTAFSNVMNINKFKFLTFVALFQADKNLNLTGLVRSWKPVSPGRDNPIQKESGMQQWTSMVQINVDMFIDALLLEGL